MKRVTCLLGAVALLAAAILATPAPPAEAAAWCRCGAFSRTHTTWGMGSSCAAAESNLYTTLLPYATCLDGPCSEPALVIVTPCYSAGGGQFKVDGYLQFRCRICV